MGEIGMSEYTIDTATKLYGLIGHPVAHSRSPYLQNELIRRASVNARYLAFDVQGGSPEMTLRGAYDMGVGGFNVTVPYKQAVMPFLAKIDEKAALIGAVNTLKYEENGWHGFNTDMPGLMRAFAHDGVSLKGRNVVVLGAGGAANAAVCAAAECGAATILILNRTEEKAALLCERFGEQYPAVRFEYGAIDTESVLRKMSMIDNSTDTMVRAISERDDTETYDRAESIKDKTETGEAKTWIALQTTSVGMHPKTDAAVIENSEFYRRIEVGYDIIFNPLKTHFMELTEAAGGKAYNGLKMLLFQGIRSFEIWNDVHVDDTFAEELLAGMLRTL